MSDDMSYSATIWPTDRGAPGLRGLQLVLIILLGTILLLPVSNLTAQSAPPVSLEIQPTTLTLRGETAYPVIAVVRNAGTQTITDLSLTPHTNLPIRLSPELETVAELMPGDEKAWLFTISSQDNEPLTGVLLFQLVYSLTPEDSTARVSRQILSKLTIAPPAKSATDEVATLTVLAPPGSINERRAKQIHLVVENKGVFPITVSGIQIETPSFISATEWPVNFPLTLAPGQKESLPLTLTASDQVETGKALVLFQGSFSWNEQGQPYQGAIVTSQEIEVGVLGESQILTLLGIPTLLFLPGFVIILTFLTFRGLRKSKEEKEKLLKVGSVEFWFFAILLSLAASFLYPMLTEAILGARRDFLGGYGFIDIVYLVVGSFLVGFLIFSTLWFSVQAVRFVKNWYTARRVPHEADSPAVTLQKLARLSESLKRQQVTVKLENGRSLTGFVLQAQDAQANAYWIIPAVEVPLTSETGGQLYALLNSEKPDIRQLLNLFPDDQLRWADAWPYRGPKLFNTDMLEFLNEKANLVVDV